MIFEQLPIPDVYGITPRKIGDSRGFFMEVFRDEMFRKTVGDVTFVQENCSLSVETGTVRGLHFQLPPRAQGKLVSCVQGVLLDVAVDIRVNSPTYGKHVSKRLTAEDGEQLWLPPGFAHGFCTLVPNTVISYKLTDYYSPEHDRGLLWNDPEIGIDWPVAAGDAVLSDKDKRQPRLADMPPAFQFQA